ncbi:hypothetical protein I4641_00990 [Waterburya agarophytonicola K14]|uniref:Uncharacterized protein n=1 Tax=Waterburya agarophytonicola KI4 TaxID=2874699 RepID=A0A964FDG9_9CYAN|nr:T3SS effector HopA1 family protein [Waterburya agarophytonicola]MCC0175555.1 hypothetical protein [Waterburya agarophytonicola KI4]
MEILKQLSSELAASLEDIVNKIEIGTDFYLRHPDYAPLEIAPEIVDNLQKLPKEFQNRYFSLQLRSYLADIYFHGCINQINSSVKEISIPLENNSIKGVDRDFYEQLEANNFGTGYFDPGWLVIREEEAGSLAVQKDNLTFHIQRDRHLATQDSQANINELVAILLPHNRWQDEFYVAISNHGLVDFSQDNQQQVIEIYFNTSPEGAIVLMRELTRQLNDIKIPFTLKVLDNPHNYPCYDAVILEIFCIDYLIVNEIIKAIYPDIQPHLYNETPICTFKLAPGISLAEATEDGFVNSRCGAIASGLLTAWYEEDNSPQNRLQCIKQAFRSQKISCQSPYLLQKQTRKNQYIPFDR